MLHRLDSYFESRPVWQPIMGALLLIGMLGPLDYYVGYEVSFSIFYTIPIIFCAWYGNRVGGCLIAFASAGVWLSMDYLAGHEYSLAWIPFWNASVRFGFFFLIVFLLTTLKERYRNEYNLARLDGLTKLLNTRAFKDEMNSILKLAARHGQSVVLAFMDLDNFKQINDVMGHSEGDAVLREVGAILRQSMRATDTLGRLGGDEFAILLPQTDIAGARVAFGNLQERLLAAMKERGWPIGFSVGVVAFHASIPEADAALRRADALMYKVKKSGKNQILYDEY